MTRRTQETMAEVEEGARSFSRFVDLIADGDAGRDISTELHTLLKVMSDQTSRTDTTAKGKLVVTFALAMEPGGMTGVAYDVKITEPKLKRATGVLWLTKGSNLVAENPRQAKLPLREVRPADVREAGDVAPATREVTS